MTAVAEQPLVVTNLCPSCLNKLPADYPYDHVAIDRALAGGGTARVAFAAMSRDEKAEVIRVGRDHGLSLRQVAQRVRRNAADLQYLLDEPEEPTADPQVAFDAKVAELYALGHSDEMIGLCIGGNRKTVQKSRDRQGLPPLYGPGGRASRAWKERGMANR
jgi:hypothetical protein